MPCCPGVTVEANSPAIQGAVRTVVTDNAGVYRIIELPPGTYSLSFSLPGFSNVKRDGLILSGSAVLTIPIELRVGAIEETVTVTGESPVVDVQTVRRETVLDQEVIASVPGARTVGNLLNATPGITVDNNGLNPTPTMTFFSARGGQTNEGRMTVNGMTVAAAFNGGGVSSYILDTVNSDEVSVTVSGGMGESDTGGPVMNLVPRAGGNQFRGTAFYNLAGDWSRGDNVSDEQRAAGITETPGIIKAYDGSVSYGGPIKRDRLWFYGSIRQLNTETAVEGIVANANAGNLARWDWARDDSLPARQTQGRRMFIGRATAQVTQKHRINFSHEYQTRCEGAPLQQATDGGCHSRGASWIASAGATTSPEAATSYIEFPYYLTQATWTAPVTNKILFEAGYTRLSYEHAGGPGQLPPDGIFGIGVTEQSTAASPGDRIHQPGTARQLRLSCAVAVRGQLEQPEPLARVGVVRDRLAQHEGRVPGLAPDQRDQARAQRYAARVPLQSGHPQPGQRGDPGLVDGRHDVGGVLLRAGRVDARPDDAAGRAALRPCLELEPGREERGHWHVGVSTPRRSCSTS